MVLWMFDNGATCHMTGNSSELQEMRTIMPISIDHLKGTNNVVSHPGTATLGGGLRLNKVLYVPTLKCNLISIAKPCKDMRCLVTFSNDACVL